MKNINFGYFGRVRNASLARKRQAKAAEVLEILAFQGTSPQKRAAVHSIPRGQAIQVKIQATTPEKAERGPSAWSYVLKGRAMLPQEPLGAAEAPWTRECRQMLASKAPERQREECAAISKQGKSTFSPDRTAQRMKIRRKMQIL